MIKNTLEAKKWKRLECAAPLQLLIICGSLLLIGAVTSSYEFIRLMRWVAFLTFAWSVYIAKNARNRLAVGVHCLLAVVFNPFGWLSFERQTWIVLDLVAAAVVLSIVKMKWPSIHETQHRENLNNFLGFWLGLFGLILGVGIGIAIGHKLELGILLTELLAFALSVAFLYGTIYAKTLLKSMFNSWNSK
jgi:hypothetical protein